MRLVEKIATIDAMTNGRYLIGFGRGLARKEYDAFEIPMDETRARFDESAKMIINALETGFIEGDGPHYPQVRTEIKPRPPQNAKDRLYGVAMSPESAQVMGELGSRMMCFVQFDMAMHRPNIERYREAFSKQHNGPVPPTFVTRFLLLR